MKVMHVDIFNLRPNGFDLRWRGNPFSEPLQVFVFFSTFHMQVHTQCVLFFFDDNPFVQVLHRKRGGEGEGAS